MKQSFPELLKKGFVILDGATGTELAKEGMPPGVCPELWVRDNPDAIRRVQRRYIDAGSNIVYAPTFGANRTKLEEYGLAASTRELNVELAGIASENAPDALCFGDVAPTGEFYHPFGEFPFEKAVAVFTEQIEALVEGGVDGIVIETMMDIQEVRAALIAARSVTNLPVLVTMTFEANGRTLNGTHIRAALDIVQSLGADAFGCNCSTGPDQMIPLLHSIAPYAHIPLIAKPNAGLPTLKDGNTVFTMDAKTFASFSGEIQQAGIAICGGCCGTTPDHIRALAAELEGKSPEAVDSIPVFSVSTPQDTYSYGPNQDVLYLDPSSDECPLVPLTSGTLLETVRQLSVSGKKVPLVTECDIIRAVREYPGTVTLSAAGTTALSESINRTKPYGARYIIRLSSAKEFCSFISAPVYRDNPKRFLLLLPPDILETFHAEAEAPSVPWGVYLTEADARNEWLAAYRLGALLDRGAACVMIDVSSLVIKNMIVAYNALLGRDDKLKICMKHFSSAENTGGAAVASGSQHPPVFTAVLNGDDESIEKLIREELDKGTPAKEIVDTQLIPAINEVGVRYEKKEYFLPQLIMSADTMSRGFEVLEPVLLDESGMSKKDGTIVIATVKGDIHDIGKNIVALMLKNYNFDVVDLGKDVDEKHILEGALKHKADIVALSALMTTTMTEMKCAIDYAKSNGLDSKFIVGGAVVDQNYADEIGADGYSADAMGAVKLARSLVGAGEDQAVQSAE